MPYKMRQNIHCRSISLGLKTISAAVASAVFLLSGAHAAGLGKLTVLSSLGQPLSAEIEVTSVSKDEAGNLSAKLASADVFRQANIDYSPALRALRFAVEQRGDRHIIKITSAQAMNEPFIDLLLELNANNARLVREYTFLLDPADLRSSQSAQIASPNVLPGLAASESQPVRTQPERVQPERVQQNNEAVAPANSQAVRRERQTRPLREAPAAVSQASEYQVKRGDTLAKIAAQVKPASVSLDQVLVALYRANPDAFIGQNMNRLRSGQILTIPDAADAGAISNKEARSVIIAQAADFNNYRNQLAGQVARATPGKAVESKQSDTGKITSKVEETATAANESKDKLKLSKANTGTANKAPNAVASAEDKIARDKAVADANARVKELEKNVSDLQKALAVRSQEMAKNQVAAAAATPGKPTAAADKAKADLAKAELAKAEQAKADLAKAEQAKAELAKAEEAKAELAKAEQAKADLAKAEQAKAELAKAEQAKAEQAKTDLAKADAAKPDDAKPAEPAVVAPPAADVKPPAPPVVKPRIVPTPPPPPPEPSFLDELKENYALPAALLALIGGLGAFGFMRARRNRKYAALSTTLMSEGASLTANSIFGSTGGQSVDTNNSIFNSNFSPSASQLDTNEVDPVAEADVYIAYGRDEQAEEILKDALRTHPDRNAVRVKLAEIYATRKDIRSFEMQASDLYGLTKGEGEEWAHVAGLGAAIDPNNPLYAGGDLPEDVAEKTATLAASSTQPLEELDPDALLFNTQSRMHLDSMPGQSSSQAGQRIDPVLDIDQIASQVAANGLDFDLSAPSERQAEPVIEAPLPFMEAADDKLSFNDLDFDLSTTASNSGQASDDSSAAASLEAHDVLAELESYNKPAPALAVQAADSAAAFGGLDFDLGDSIVEEIDMKSPEPEVKKPVAGEPADLDFNFNDAEIVSPAAALPDQPVASVQDDMAAFNFDFKEDAPVDANTEAVAGSATPALPEVSFDAATSWEPSFDLDKSASALPGLPEAAVPEAGLAATPFAAPQPATEALDLNLNGIDLDLDPHAADSASGAGEAAGSWDEATSEDAEMTTKLDLAAAYQDIGDKEGARELLDEVIKGGTPEQIEKAMAMHKNLG